MHEQAQNQRTRRVIVGITGASGALYAQRTIEMLLRVGLEVHLVISPLGQRLLHDELGIDGADLSVLSGGQVYGESKVQSPADAGTQDSGPTTQDSRRRTGEGRQPVVGAVVQHNFRDVGASIASGSFVNRGMIVVPCSANTLSCVAHGQSQNLIHRAAQVALKERRKLVLVHREMPLSLTEIRNMEAATQAGAIVAPANPGFYLLPQSIGDLVDFVVGRCLDLLEIDHDLNVRWQGGVGGAGGQGVKG